MRVLWLCNMALPEANLLLGKKVNPFGSWISNAAFHLAKLDNIELSVAFPQLNINNITEMKGKEIIYYAFPRLMRKNGSSKIISSFVQNIVREVEPDLIHIFGTDYPCVEDFLNGTDTNKTVINLQGIAFTCAIHYCNHLPNRVIHHSTFKEIIKQSNIYQLKRRFEKQAIIEKHAIQKVKYVIGRTTWDYASSKLLNQNVQYYLCNEILRDEFYKHTWNINECDKNSIFIGQGSYPIKGLHFMLEAMPIILKRFPDTKLYIGGEDFVKSKTIIDRIKLGSYGRYVKELINKNKLDNNVVFVGILDEKQICERYLKSNVFVLPSVVENESNSLSEAKILGVPCVASYVGGVIDRIEHGKDGFYYQHDAPYMLAHYVCEIFSHNQLAISFSEEARNNARKINDPKTNIQRLLNIYDEILT